MRPELVTIAGVGNLDLYWWPAVPPFQLAYQAMVTKPCSQSLNTPFSSCDQLTKEILEFGKQLWNFNLKFVHWKSQINQLSTPYVTYFDQILMKGHVWLVVNPGKKEDSLQSIEWKFCFTITIRNFQWRNGSWKCGQYFVSYFKATQPIKKLSALNTCKPTQQDVTYLMLTLVSDSCLFQLQFISFVWGTHFPVLHMNMVGR
jgi:hypothetical protein